jgi:HPt (histidine-containing phosphotransfer) domain-containing protein
MSTTLINLEYVQEIADNDTEFITELLNDYITKVPEQYQLLANAFEQQNTDQTRFMAHKLKSSFQFTGVSLLVELAQKIEKRCTENDLSEVGTFINEMNPLIQTTIEELNAEIKKLNT